MTLCKWLRWKTYYGGQWKTRADLQAMFAMNEVPYDCLKTCQAWGPDDGVVSPECCGPQRTCFVPSAKLPPEVMG